LKEGSYVSIRVIIADDHSIVRQGLHLLLNLDQELEVVGEAADGAEAINLARQLKPDVVVMDLLMPVIDGITATSIIRKELPDTEVLALTSVLEVISVVDAVRAGAIGYVVKDRFAKDVCKAIKDAAAGKVQLSSEAVARLMREMRGGESESPSVDLTQRELTVLKLMAQGVSNKQIAEILEIMERTVKTHVSSILSKMGVQSRTQAAFQAIQMGLVDTKNSD
jgi:DNA-binding NarL/FixJ family response regulator